MSPDRSPVELLGLHGKVAVVTGAGGGIGSGIARRFASAGAGVVLHYRTSERAATVLLDELAAAGAQAVTVRADLTEPGGAEAVVAAATERFGRLDAWVNNAGVQPVQPLAGMTAGDWRAVVDANLTSTFACTQAVAAHLREAAHGGSVIHVASIEGSHPAPAHAHYAASKAAVIMHARAAALEYGGDGIRVNTVSPGLIHREGLEDAWPEGVARWHAACPLGRLGDAADVGDACVFLASDLARWITGHDLVVDGGVSARPTW